jgi:hypothetical protein
LTVLNRADRAAQETARFITTVLTVLNRAATVL